MKTISVFAALFGVFLLHSTSRAQQTPPAGGLAPDPPRSDFFTENGVAKFCLRSGRLLMDRSSYRKGSSRYEYPQAPAAKNGKPAAENEDVANEAIAATHPGRLCESITVMATRGVPSMHYASESAEHQIRITVQDAKWLRIESKLHSTGEQATLEQPHQGDLVWTVQRGQLRDEYRGATLLHLLAQDATGLNLHCGELFRQLLDGRCVMQINRQTQQRLLHQLSDVPPVSDESVNGLVEGLRSGRASTRRRATKQLLQLGRPAAPALRRILASSDLELEQRDRLQAVLSQIEPQQDDTPASLASRLANDHDHWRHVAPKLTEDQIRLVDRRLAGLNLSEIRGATNGARLGPSDRISSRRR